VRACQSVRQENGVQHQPASPCTLRRVLLTEATRALLPSGESPTLAHERNRECDAGHTCTNRRATTFRLGLLLLLLQVRNAAVTHAGLLQLVLRLRRTTGSPITCDEGGRRDSSPLLPLPSPQQALSCAEFLFFGLQTERARKLQDEAELQQAKH
jgi:hypothetical protein